MLNFFNKYPYTDFHELNLDWLLAEMQKVEEHLNNIVDEVSSKVLVEVLDRIEPELDALQDELTSLQSDYDTIAAKTDNLQIMFEDFVNYVNRTVNAIYDDIDASSVGCNEYTNARIAANNEWLLSELTQYLANIKVINFFTGEQVGIQDMLDYLASLHVTDSLDYSTMALRSKTYTELAAFNKTYTELVTNGNTWYV